MKAGILLPHLGDYATRENVLYIVMEAEKESLDSVWALERLLWPLKPQTPAGLPDGARSHSCMYYSVGLKKGRDL